MSFAQQSGSHVEKASVVVIGGGPAGSTASCLLRQAAPTRRIVLVEREEFPRHHIGESTLPDINPILKKLGVLERVDSAGFVRKHGISYKWSHDKPAFSEIFSRGVLSSLASDRQTALPDYSWQVERGLYDQVLLENARAHGVEVLQPATVEGLLREGDRVGGVRVRTADGAERVIESDFVVDCSGQARLLSRWLRLEKRAHALGDLAIYRYYRNFRWREDLIGSADYSKIFFTAHSTGWSWFIPIAPDFVSVGVVTRREFTTRTPPEVIFERSLVECRELAEMLEGATHAPAPHSSDPEAKTHVIADWSYSHGQPCGPGWYLAGDAAAFVDPILSSGMLLAHQSGMAAAHAINTEWQHPDLPVAELHAGYGQFYRDMYDGFLTMARWWYERREVGGIDEWLAAAAHLGENARGLRQVATNDVSAFMTFAAGYFTDFRFVNLGCAFGDQGLADVLNGLEGNHTGERIRRGIADRGQRLTKAFDSVTVESYITTDVDTDRWWRLPAFRFQGDFSGEHERVYRPPVPQDFRGERLPLVLRIIERTLARCDGTLSVEETVRAVRRQTIEYDEARVRWLCNMVLSDLVLLKILRPA